MIPDCYDPAYQEELAQRAHDAWLNTRPICKDCGRRIASERCLPISEYGVTEYVCERCADRRMIDTDELEVSA